MDPAANLKDLRVGMLHPGITVSTTPENYNLFRKLQMLTIDGKHLVPTGRQSMRNEYRGGTVRASIAARPGGRSDAP